MKKQLSMITAIALVLFALVGTAHAQSSAGASTKLQPLPRELEMRLALSSLPPHLRDQATVYALNPDKGFEVARKGTNGFHAFVARIGDDTFRGTWPLKAYRDDILYPISFDAAGAKEQMRVFFDAAQMQARGTPAEELKKTIKERYATHYYKAAQRPGVSYMLAPILRNYTSPDLNDEVQTASFPHVMHYAPNVSAKDVGAQTPTPEQLRYFQQHGRWENTPYPMVILDGPHGYMIQPRGEAERQAIAKDNADLLAQLCKIKDVWCLPREERRAGTQ
jgi:hypothetical protein